MSTKASKKKTKFQDFNYSSIFEHQKVGKKMVPPLNMLPTTKNSWLDDGAPEMLWAFAVAQALPREEYLACFRAVTQWCLKNLPPYEERVKAATTANPTDIEPPGCDVEMAELAKLPNEKFDDLASLLSSWSDCTPGLATLGALTTIPGHQHWARCFPTEEPHWDILAAAIAPAVDHQSEVSTDIRWLKVYLSIAFGKMQFPETMKKDVEEILDFPQSGDLRQIRPLIRSTEGALRSMKAPLQWMTDFWDEVYQRTGCVDSSKKTDYDVRLEKKVKQEDLVALRLNLLNGFVDTTTTTAIDYRHDGAFGIMLYALSVAGEVCGPSRASSITGRIGLRTLAELYISFAYLAAKDDKALWYEYRNFGNGQTKLAFLKTEIRDGTVPEFMDQEALFQMANEDTWQEFVDVNTGHWANLNLRKLAMEGGTKDVYDKYYDWTSTYAHGHWGAIRDSNFVTCFNPLHRFHRIPRITHRLLPAVTTDAVELLNAMLALLLKLYPALGDISAIPIHERSDTAQTQAEVPCDGRGRENSISE